MSDLWPVYLFLFLLCLAWLRVELKNQSTSRGLGAIILGSLLFSYGLTIRYADMLLFSWLTPAIGFAIALYGLAKLTAKLVADEQKNHS